MARAYWKGSIRLSLVVVPVRLHLATDSRAGVSLHQYSKKTGERIRYQKVTDDSGPLDKEDIVKGYEVEKGKVVTLEPDELEQVKIESKETIDIVQFVDWDEIDPLYYERPYYVVPDGKVATEGFSVIREALRQSRKVALGQVAMLGREYITAIRPCNRGMLLETLRFADEVKRPSSFFGEIPEVKADKDHLELALELIERKAAPFDPHKFHDRYEAALKELIAAKAAHRQPKAEPQRPRGSNVIDLMDALKRSVQGGEKPPARGPKAGSAKSAAARKPKAKSAAKPKRAAARQRKSA